MRSLSRIVWSEGMHLAQHHFQAQSSYFEALTAFTFANLFFKPYGLAGLELDTEALLNGTASVIHARGVMPDGLTFHFPEDPAPAPLAIKDLFAPTADSHLLLLAIPPYRPDQANCAPEAADDAKFRYRSAVESLPDETTGRDERPVSLAEKNFRLMLDTAEPSELVTLPIARIRRDGAGHFVYDADYVPPCLQIGASERLMQLLSRVVDMLDVKASALAEERRASQGDVAEYASREIAGFWLSHAIHASLAPLRHLLQTRSAHPEQLFTELSRLGGALCTFSLTSHPRTLPAYDHDHPEECFDALDRHIRAHLNVVLPTKCVSIPLGQAEPQLWTGAVRDARTLARSFWFLGVRSSAGPAEVISQVPKLVKICSAEHIAELVKRAYPALPLEHVPNPPPELSPRIGTQYFRIGTMGPQGAFPCWTLISNTRGVGLYSPAAIPDVQFEILVVVEEA